MFRFIRTTLAGGLFFLVPIVVLAVIVEKALIVAHKVVAPLAARLPHESGIGLETPKILAVALIVLFCFLAGVFARTALARKIVSSLEASVLLNIPGYEFFKSIGESVLGVNEAHKQQVVLVRFDDSWQVGFVLAQLDTGEVGVFIPDAPNPHSGTVAFMSPDRITRTDISTQETLKCLKRLGGGSKELLHGVSLRGA